LQNAYYYQHSIAKTASAVSEVAVSTAAMQVFSPVLLGVVSVCSAHD